MKIILIRHGETAGNRERRYVGRRTDEGLTAEAREAFLKASGERNGELYRIIGPVGEIFESPMRRCVETRKLLFPESEFFDCPVTDVPGLSECDFGRFEYKNHLDLNGDEDYQKFIDSGGMSGFPGGETTEEFKERCVRTFGELTSDRLKNQDAGDGSIVFVVHGGTIMAVLEAFARPSGDYYSFQVKNGCGYACRAVPDPLMPFGFHLADIAKVSSL